MKRITNQGWLAGVIAGIALLWAGEGFAGAALPFYASINAKPNVLILLDTSGSMDWAIDGSSPGTGESSRFDIARRVLTGTGRINVKYNNNQVYGGKEGGEFNVYNDLAAKFVFVDVLLMKYNSAGRYELISAVDVYPGMLANGDTPIFFTIKNNYDHPLQTGNANTGAATYPFHKFLRDLNSDNKFTKVTDADIVNDGYPLARPIYKANASGALTFKGNLVNSYNKYNNLKVTRVKLIAAGVGTGCYKVGTKWYSCYKPIAFPAVPPDAEKALIRFVIWDADDYSYNTATMNAASKTLYDFIVYLKANSVITSTYNSYNTFTTSVVCGDGSLGTCPANGDDGKGTRTIYEIKKDGTSGASTVNPKATWTSQEVADNIYNNIPMVTLVDAVTVVMGVNYAHEFTKTVGTTKEADAVRAELGYSAVTWSESCLDHPYFCRYFDNNNNIFTGLPYTALVIDNPGIMDIYDVRYGLMTFDTSGSNNEFPGSGGNVIYKLSDGSTDNTNIQEIIACSDLNGDGHKWDGSSNYSCPSPSGNTPIAGLLRDAFTYLYGRYFLSCNAAGDQPYCCGKGSYTYTNKGCDYNITSPSHPKTAPLTPSLSGYSINPSPFGQWTPSQWDMTDFGGHILLNDPYYYYQCRTNNIILLTDGGQSTGEPCVSTCSYQTDTTAKRDPVIAAQTKYISYLKDPSSVPGVGTYTANGETKDWLPTKVYVIGFALNANPTGYDKYAPDMLIAMAAASDLPDDTPMGLGIDDAVTPFYANTETELLQQFDIIMKMIMKGVYSRSAPAVNVDLTAGVAAYFDVSPGTELLWMGHLAFMDLTSAQGLKEGSTTVAVQRDAAELLNSRNSSTREIFTSLYNDSTEKWDRVNFVSGSASQLAESLFPGYPNYNEYLDQNDDTVLNATDAAILIDFIRIENGSTYKGGEARSWKLGAIYHSTPISAGKPPKSALKNDATYQAYADHYADTPEIIYVGALDGMLHTFFFEDPDGAGIRSIVEEAFAYVPNYLLGSLWHLRLGEQQIYVDGDPSVAVMKTGYPSAPDEDWCDAGEEWCWQTVLYGGLRDGGPAYYSLNVTNISTDQGSSGDSVTIRWEFADPDDGGTDSILGNTWSLPYIDELLYQPEDADTLDTRVAVIFGGGASPDLKPYQGSWLYILDADTGTQIKTILVPSTNQYCDIDPGDLLTADNYAEKCDLTVNNTNQVLSDVLVTDVDFDGFPDWGYFGDLQGRVWKLNVHDPDPANWGICLFFDSGDTGYDDLSDPEADCEGNLQDYSATDKPDCVTTSKRRPFFYRADTTVAPRAQGWLVYIGTGHIEQESEIQDETIRNYVFALLDEDNVGECSYAAIWGGHYDTGSGWPIKLGVNEKLASPPVVLTSSVYAGEVSFRSYVPHGTTNPCIPGLTYKWNVDFDTGKGAIWDKIASAYVQKVATEGFPGKSLIIGDVEFSFNPPSAENPEGFGEGTFEKKAISPLQGFYYWWVK